MKITVISIFFPPETGAGPNRIFNMCQSLQKRGADIEVITALPNYPNGRIFKPYKGKLFVKETIGNIPTQRYWLYATVSKKPMQRILNMLSFSVALIFALPSLWRRSPDIIIVNNVPLLAGFSGVLLGRLTKATIVSNISDIWPLTALELGAIKKGKVYSFLEKLEYFIYKKSNVCLTQSKETIQHIQKKVPHKQTFLYRNLSQKSVFLHQKMIYEIGKLKVVYAGLLGLAQGIYGICEQINFKDLGIEFHIYGAGNEFESIQQYITENLDCNIFLHNMIPKEQVPKMLSNFHATLIPLVTSIYGAMPSKVFMATASGLPIFFSGGGEGAAIVNKYELGWVNQPKNYAALKQNLVGFSKMGEQAYQMQRAKIINIACSEFDFEIQHDTLFTILKEAIKTTSIPLSNKTSYEFTKGEITTK